jgi:ABC-type lipoprotein export system ATPase subunit
VPKWYLNKIEVLGGFLSGLSLELPKGLVCVIGPRGSGKSTLAEAMRYVFLGTKGPSDDRYALIKANLGQSVVTALAQRDSDGTMFTVRRTFGQPAALIGADGRSVAEVDLDRGTFLPIDGYSADRIEKIAVESLGDLRRTLLDELRAEELHRIQMKVSEYRRQLEANADAIRTADRTISDFTERMEELGDARVRLGSLPKPSDDLSSAALVTASKQSQINKEEARNLAEVRKAAEDSRSNLKALRSELVARLERSLCVSSSRNSEAIEPLDEALRRVATEVADLAAQIDSCLANSETLIRRTAEELLTLHKAQEAEYADLQERNHVAGIAIREHTAAQQAVASLESVERRRTEAQEQLRQLREQRKEIKGDYLLEHERVSEVREMVAAELQREAGTKVRVRIARNADSLDYQQTLLGGLKGARVKNHGEILRSLMRLRPEQLAQIIQENDFDELEELTSLGTERGRKILNSCRENLDPLSLEIVAIEDKVSIELNVGTEEDPNFKDAAELSSGQKCTALLPLLMARRDTPLIIDQPEDNLDNHFIYESVVETILRLKTRRQMIFVTHNANIPVLGEAEMIIVLDSDGRAGRVTKAGTLDECRDEIIDLLEGGRVAFELRRKRYASK